MLKIVENDRQYLPYFVEFNLQWIKHYFVVEPDDQAMADNPGQYIDDGGYIFTLLDEEQPVAVCALVKADEGCFELAKMGVPTAHRGKGYGNRLLEHVMEKLTQINAQKVYLISNTRLRSAIHLYEKYGFVTTHLGPHPRYQRGDIIMEKQLAQKR